MKTVFLSSTGKDLSEYRDNVFRAIQKLQGFHCIRMEDFVATDKNPLDHCRDSVAECDIFVGMVGHYFGSCPKGEAKSFTEFEYEQATALNMPRLMFVAPEDFLVPANLRESEENHKKQQVFRVKVLEDRIVSSFNSPSELALQVTTAICNYLLQSFSDMQKQDNRCIFVIEGVKSTNVRVEKLTDGRLRILPNPQDPHIKKITIISQKYSKPVTLDFETGRLPKGAILQRASGGYYRPQFGGPWEYAGINVPRFEESENGVKCLLIEQARTNLFLNSDTPAKQFISLWPGTFTLWVKGNGGAEVRPGEHGVATENSPLIFTLENQKRIEIDVKGEADHIQLETGPYPTSQLPTKQATVTRAGDMLSLDIPYILASQGI